MDKRQYEKLIELMEISFCLLDINLFLDTHPNDQKALMLHNTWAKKYQELNYEYSSMYGPLQNTMLSKYPYEYVQSPWPWEIDYCGCN